MTYNNADFRGCTDDVDAVEYLNKEIDEVLDFIDDLRHDLRVFEDAEDNMLALKTRHNLEFAQKLLSYYYHERMKVERARRREGLDNAT